LTFHIILYKNEIKDDENEHPEGKGFQTGGFQNGQQGLQTQGFQNVQQGFQTQGFQNGQGGF
jgi:hypothetical protein